METMRIGGTELQSARFQGEQQLSAFGKVRYMLERWSEGSEFEKESEEAEESEPAKARTLARGDGHARGMEENAEAICEATPQESKEERVELASVEQRGWETQAPAADSSMATDSSMERRSDSSAQEEEGMEATNCALLAFDFFSEGGRASASISHRWDGAPQQLQHPALLMPCTKQLMRSRSAISIANGDELMAEEDNLFSGTLQSEIVPGFSQSEPDLVCLDLCLGLSCSSHTPNSATQENSGKEHDGRRNLANEGCKATPTTRRISMDLCELVPRPCSITLSTGTAGNLTETDDCRCREWDSHSLRFPDQKCRQLVHQICSQESSDIGRGYELQAGRREDWEGHESGISWSCLSKKILPIPTNINASIRLFNAFPGALNIDLLQALASKAADSGTPHHHTQGSSREHEAESIRDAASHVAPLTATCLESSECDNFGAEMTTRNSSSSSPSLMANLNGGYCHRLEEVDAMSEAGESENCKEEEVALALEIDTTEAAADAKNVSHGALDLLVNAIQLTSDTVFEDEVAYELSGQLRKGECSRESHHNSLCGASEVHIFGTSPILKKRILRRAKSAFKNKFCEHPNKEAPRDEVSEAITNLPLKRRGRRKREASEDQHANEDAASDDAKAEIFGFGLMMEGAPVIRSKRARSHALPKKFCDSVLQPWKRKATRNRSSRLKCENFNLQKLFVYDS